MSTNKYLAKVRHDVDAAGELGVNSTPTLFLDGKKLENAPDYGYFRVKIEEALNAAGR